MRIPKLACLTSCLILATAPVFAADLVDNLPLPIVPGISFEIGDGISTSTSGICPEPGSRVVTQTAGYNCVIHIFRKDAADTPSPTFNLNQTFNYGDRQPGVITGKGGAAKPAVKIYEAPAREPDTITVVPSTMELPFSTQGIYDACHPTEYSVSMETAARAFNKYYRSSAPSRYNDYDAWRIYDYWNKGDYHGACYIISEYTRT